MKNYSLMAWEGFVSDMFQLNPTALLRYNCVKDFFFFFALEGLLTSLLKLKHDGISVCREEIVI